MSSENTLKFPLQTLILFPVTVPGRSSFRYNFAIGVLFLISLLIILPSCVQTTESGGAPPPKSTRIELPSTSPNRVVEGYLEALKKQNYGKAYSYGTIGYAGNLDREGYEINFRGFVEKLQWLLLNYEIIGIKILGNQAYVVVEINTKYKPLNSENFKLKNVRVQYNLGIIDESWLILGDRCILNCEGTHTPEIESVKPVEIN